MFSLNNVRAVKESLITPPVAEKRNRAASFTYSLLALEAIGGKDDKARIPDRERRTVASRLAGSETDRK